MLLLGKVDPHNFRLPHLNLAQQLTKRHDCICGMDGRCGYFGEQGLEDEVVVGVDQLDVELAAPKPSERLGREHAAEAAADYQHLLLNYLLIQAKLLVPDT